MKKGYIIILIFAVLIGCVTLWRYKQRAYPFKPDPSPLPAYLTDQERELFSGDFLSLWRECGPKPKFNANIQSDKLTVLMANGGYRNLKTTDIVTFKGWGRENSKFIYYIRFHGEDCKFSSKSPFELFYNVNLLKRRRLENLYGLRNDYTYKHDRINTVYLTMVNFLIADTAKRYITYPWLRTLLKNYQSMMNKPSEQSEIAKSINTTPSFHFKLWFNLNEEDITPAMAQLYQNCNEQSKLYVQKPKGLAVFDTKGKPYSKLQTLPFDYFKNDQNSVCQLLDYRKKNGDKYIKAKLYKTDTVFIRVNSFDDLLPVKPADVNYLSLVQNVVKLSKPNSDQIFYGFLYLDRLLHIDILNGHKNSPVYNPLIEKLLNQAGDCTIGNIGPKSLGTATVQSDGLPDPIVRKHYDNLDFLIPAWCSYNSAGERSKRTGVYKNDEYPGGFKVLRGHYKMYIPTVKDLLSTTTLSDLLQGYGLESLSYDTTMDGLTKNNLQYLYKLQKDSIQLKNAVILNTTSSYTVIATEVYRSEGLSEGEINIVAKALREVNLVLQHSENNGTARIFEESSGSQQIIVPLSLKTLGIQKNPIKSAFEYTLQFN